MDEVPFLEVDLTEISDNEIDELKKFKKEYFNVDNILSTASALKYTSAIKELIHEELENPSEEFIRFLLGREKIKVTNDNKTEKVKVVYAGRVNQNVLDQFEPLVKKTFSNIIEEKVDNRLKSALANAKNEAAKKEAQENVEPETTKNEPIITEEELETFYMIKTFLMEDKDIIENPERISYKKNKGYLAINLDNVRKPLCRLHEWDFSKKSETSIGLFEDESNNDTEYPVKSIYDVYQYKQQLIDRLNLLKKK
jgi:hypothetical protein